MRARLCSISACWRRASVHESRHEKERRADAVCDEDRECDLVAVAIAVIDGHHYATPRLQQLLLTELIRREDFAVPAQQSQLSLQRLGGSAEGRGAGGGTRRDPVIRERDHTTPGPSSGKSPKTDSVYRRSDASLVTGYGAPPPFSITCAPSASAMSG